RRNDGEVGDSADVLHNPADAAVAIQQKVEEGNQWRPFAARRHVCRPEVRNHWDSEACRENGALAGLPRDGQPSAKKPDRLTLVIQCLSMTAHKLSLEPKAPLGRKNCVGI